MVKFREQLASFGLRLKEMVGDGNCLFRAIADQLDGNEKLHKKYREYAVQFLNDNKPMFAPFIEDDETIEEFIAEVEKDGEWGG